MDRSREGAIYGSDDVATYFARCSDPAKAPKDVYAESAYKTLGRYNNLPRFILIYMLLINSGNHSLLRRMTVFDHLELVNDLLDFLRISSPPQDQKEKDGTAYEDAGCYADREPDLSSSRRFHFLLKTWDYLQVLVVNGVHGVVAADVK